jgi:hypothetical protein
MLALELTCLSQDRARTVHISKGKFQAGEKHLTGNKSVSVFYLPRQLETLLPVLLGSIQVVPFVAYTGQTKMRYAGNWQRMITKQLQGAPVGLGCQIELVFGFLQAAQADGSRYSEDDIPRRLTNGYDFGIRPAGRGTVSLDMVGKPQFPDRRSAESQVVGMQILQSTARLGYDGFYLVLINSHRGPNGGNTSDKISGLVVWLGTLQSCLSRL